jgi:chemotaxis protein MotB
MAGAGGGAWKVAYADFVTAMRAFFLVMWITAQSNAVKQSVAKYFEHPFDAMSRSPVPASGTSGASLVPMHRDMDGTPPHSINKGKSAFGGGMLTDNQPPADPQTVPKSGGVRRRSGFMLRDDDPSGMGNVIVFQDGSLELDNRAQQALDEMLPIFSGKLNMVEIRGTTLAQLPGAKSSMSSDESQADAWRASYERCLAVMKYLEDRGIEAKRIRLSQSGHVEPLVAASEQDANNHDSRVEVYMLSEFADEYLEGSAQTDEHKQPANLSAEAPNGPGSNDKSPASESPRPVALPERS